MITHSVEIARTPADVFAYLNDLERHGEWQSAIVSSKQDTPGPVGVGTRATDVRKIPGGPRPFTYEITVHEPPSRVVFKGVNGPVRPEGTVTVEPLDDGARSRVTIEFDLKGHGIGVLLAPLARRDARKSIPKDHETLKAKLEAGA